MKNSLNGRYHTRVVVNIIYSTVVACMVMVFLVTNLSMIGQYAAERGMENSLVLLFYRPGTMIVLLYVLLGIGVFSVSFLLLQSRSMRYISRISSAMREIAEGDLNITLDVEGDDEFADMAENLNNMVEELRQLMDKERESERTKNELITNVAHDLRTPLTSIIGYLELLSGPVKLNEEMQKKYLDITYKKSKRLQKLIEDLFGFTKLNYGKISMKVSKVDIVKLLSQMLEEFYPNFMEKNLAYELQSNVTAKVITADGNLLARLFDNLINNAIKYGSEGKKIIVKVDATDTVVTVSVTNFGYVIPKEELFGSFYESMKAFESPFAWSALPENMHDPRTNGTELCIVWLERDNARASSAATVLARYGFPDFGEMLTGLARYGQRSSVLAG